MMILESRNPALLLMPLEAKAKSSANWSDKFLLIFMPSSRSGERPPYIIPLESFAPRIMICESEEYYHLPPMLSKSRIDS